MKSILKSRRGIYKFVQVFSLVALVLNMSFMGVFFIAEEASADVYIEPNPTLIQSCGLDMVLIIDSSSSMYGSPLQDEKDAFNAFVDAFLPQTPAQIAVVDFNTTASLLEDYTTDVDDLHDAINSVTTTEGDSPSNTLFTNWHDALVKAHNEFNNRPDAPDLYVLASDGNPNRYGTQGDVHDADEALAQAIAAANQIKSDGVRIITLGMGTEVDSDKLQQISGPNVSPPSAVDKDSDVILTDFSNLASTLADLANELCGGTVTVKKYLNGDLDAGWDFSALVDDTPPAMEGTTDGDGMINFDIVTDGNTVSVDITEIIEPGFALDSANCWTDYPDNLNPIGTFDGIDTVSGLMVSKHDVVTCEFYNIDDPCGYSVWGYKYNSDTEAPIAGWEIELVEPTGYPVAATTTDVNGYYYFDGLCEGQYYIEEVLGDWTQDQPVSGYFDVIIPDMYDFYGPYDFWNTPPAGPSTGSITIIKETAISSEVIFEFNGDIGEFELGDTESHTQDGLEASTYYIYEENLQPGWYFADFDCGDAIIIDSDSVGVSIALREGEDVICTFYNIYGEGTIEVCKYEDINGDGEPDYEEYAKASLWDKIKSSIVKTAHAMMPTGYPLGGWIMNIVGDNSHTDSGPTDSGDGCISFTVPYGTYTVSENTQTGWTQTYPTDCGGAPINHTVTIEEGHEYERVYFLNYDDPTYCGDGIVQSPNDDGFYEECDGSAPCGYTCNNDCTLEKESSGGGTLFPTFRGGGTTGQTSSPSTPTVAGEEGAPVLVISKTVDQEIVNVGDEVEYIITVTNNGSLTAFEVNLEDLLPEGLEFVDDESSTKSWDLGDIAPGVSKSATVIVKVTGDITIGTITNTATAEAANHGAVEASADVEIVEVAVLAETGFDLKEFVLMFIGAISLAVLTVGLRRRLLA